MILVIPHRPNVILAVEMETETRKNLARYFMEHTNHTWEDAGDMLVFATADCGGTVEHLGNLALDLTVILDRCMDIAPSITAFHTWKNMHMALDHEVRLHPDIRTIGVTPTPVTWWPVAFACWLITGQPDYAHSAVRAVYTFRKRGVEIGHAMHIVHMLLREPESTARRDFMELLESGALLRDDFKDSATARATMYDPNLPALVALWRNGNRKMNLRKLAGRIAEAKRREAARNEKRTTTLPLTITPAVIVSLPKPIVVEPLAPATLPDMLERHLPAKVQPVAQEVAVALSVMKADRRTWSIDAIADRVQMMLGGARQVAKRLIENAFKWLAAHGVVENVNGYRLRQETQSELGNQILRMV